MSRKTEPGRELVLFLVMTTKVLANEEVRHFFNLTAKECWESANCVLCAKQALRVGKDGGIIDFNSSEHMS